MAPPRRGEVWLVDMGYAAKVRPALVLSIAPQDNERVLTTVVPHTTSVRDSRFESPSYVRWLDEGVFDAQGLSTYPTVKLIRRLGVLPDEQLATVEERVLNWLGLRRFDIDG